VTKKRKCDRITLTLANLGELKWKFNEGELNRHSKRTAVGIVSDFEDRIQYLSLELNSNQIAPSFRILFVVDNKEISYNRCYEIILDLHPNQTLDWRCKYRIPLT